MLEAPVPAGKPTSEAAESVADAHVQVPAEIDTVVVEADKSVTEVS